MLGRRSVVVRVAAAVGLCMTLPWPAVEAQQPAARSGGREARGGGPAAAAVLAATVLDEESGAPLSGVAVAIGGAPADLVTDGRGSFTVALTRADRLFISLRRLGYRAAAHVVDVPVGDTTRVSFFLVRVVQLLDTVAVAGEAASRSPKLEGFERRRRQSLGGTFLTRSHIERRKAVETVDLLRGLLGVRLVDSLGVRLIASPRGVRPVVAGRRVDAAPCYMLIGVDGQLRPWGYDVNEISPDEIHGIEVYSGPAAMPRELMGLMQDGATCGLVMIWTRVDR